jgi:FAD/FMN-containing dehydrogenase
VDQALQGGGIDEGRQALRHIPGHLRAGHHGHQGLLRFEHDELAALCRESHDAGWRIGKHTEREHGIPLPTIGHAADGNVHTHAMRRAIDDGLLGAEIDGWRERHERVRAGIYDDAMARGGVISGEHGIGLVKKDLLARNVGAGAVAAMRAIKRALDPKGIINPGKIFD